MFVSLSVLLLVLLLLLAGATNHVTQHWIHERYMKLPGSKETYKKRLFQKPAPKTRQATLEVRGEYVP